MSTTLKPIAFLDLDGPILDVSYRHHQVYADLVQGAGGRPLGRESFWTAKRQKVSDEKILDLTGTRIEPAVYQKQKLAAIEASSSLALDRLQPDVTSILGRLATRYRLVLVTLRHSRPALDLQLAALELKNSFEVVLSAPAGGEPGWKVKSQLVSSAGLVPTAGSFFVGDTETDILAGRALQVSTVAVSNGIREESFLRALSPDWIISSLAQLSATNFLP